MVLVAEEGLGGRSFWVMKLDSDGSLLNCDIELFIVAIITTVSLITKSRTFELCFNEIGACCIVVAVSGFVVRNHALPVHCLVRLDASHLWT